MTLLLRCPVFSTMHSLSGRFSAATLFLVLCLQLGISKAQDSINTRKPLLFYLEVPNSAVSGEEVTVKLGLETEYNECMVVKAYLVSSTPMEGSFNYNQTRCLCNDYRVTFYWDFPVYQTFRFAIVVEIIKEKNICPNNEAVVPISGDSYKQEAVTIWSTGYIFAYGPQAQQMWLATNEGKEPLGASSERSHYFFLVEVRHEQG